jgi:RES domain-containing protein
MKVFRIERKKYLKETLSGKGASLSDGMRWNSMHTRMVYTAQSRALAMLEIAVHLDLNEDLPNDRLLIELEIPDQVKIKHLDLKSLPDDWDAKPPGITTQLFGDEFVSAQEFAIMRVPSSIVPEEFNFLINPLHPDARKIKVIGHKPLQLDPRLTHKK